MVALRLAAILVAALVAAGVISLVTYRVTFAAVILPHGSHGSGIPYWPGAWQESNNYTYSTWEHDQSILRWLITYPRTYIAKFQAGDIMTQYMVYSGSGQDQQLAAWYGAHSCQWYTDTYPSNYNAPAFMFGHTTLNVDKNYTVVCLNVGAFGYPDRFENYSLETRIKMVEHEMGHSLHLDHLVGEGIMDPCACLYIDPDEVSLINWLYAGGHP